MATIHTSPYFPPKLTSPPDEKRLSQIKLAVFGRIVLLVTHHWWCGCFCGCTC